MAAGVPYTFTPGQTPIDANQVNANFNAITSYINGLSIPTTPVSIANGGTNANTAAQALTNFGLTAGLIIPCSSVSVAGGTLSLTAAAGSPIVSQTGYEEGTTYLCQTPSAVSGTIYVKDTTSGTLSAALLFGTSSLSAGQVLLLTYINSVFVLLNPVAPTAQTRFAEFSASGTITVPAGVNIMYATGCAPGGGGGSGNSGQAGGGGGGGGASVTGYALTVTPGHLLAINLGSPGSGGSGSAGSAGGTTTIVDSSTATTLLTLGGGLGGAQGTSTSSLGGAAGGAGAGAGQAGFYEIGTLSIGGGGGLSLFGAGGAGGLAVSGAAPGQAGQGFGGGGGGGGNSTGGAGGPSSIRLDW